MEIDYRDKARGMLVGLAIGDALGAPVEFGYSSYDIRELGDKIEHFEDHRIPKGVWTDDTEMALCIADSLIEKGGYDSFDIMDKFQAWAYKGYRTYDKKPASDIGIQTRAAISEYSRHPIISKDTPKSETAGNGAIMRLAPIILSDAPLKIDPFKPRLRAAIYNGMLSARETHNSIAAETVTGLFSASLYSALFSSIFNFGKQTIAKMGERQLDNEECERFCQDHYNELFNRALEKDDHKLRDLGGYIVDSFAIALWGFIQFDSFKDGLLAVIRLGGDTDTNSAIYGQLAGAYYGYHAIPEEWRNGVYLKDELVDIADKLYDMPECPTIRTRFEN